MKETTESRLCDWLERGNNGFILISGGIIGLILFGVWLVIQSYDQQIGASL